jgi:limonene-1,2-epoxide hydrolase
MARRIDKPGAVPKVNLHKKIYEATMDRSSETATPTVDDAAKLRIARDMVTAWDTKNWRAVADLFNSDGVLHSMMVEPVIGRAAIYERVAGLGAGIDSITLDVREMGMINGRVFIERVDRFVYNGKAGSVPVVGILAFRGAGISEWREYYDRQTLLNEMGAARDFDHHGR